MARRPARRPPHRPRPDEGASNPPVSDRDKIIEAFFALLAEQAFEDIGYADLAARAGVSLATLRREALEADGREWTKDDEEAFKSPIRAKYETEGSPYYATARLWDDGIIAPRETRRVLSLAFSATLNAPAEPTRFGVFRM